MNDPQAPADPTSSCCGGVQSAAAAASDCCGTSTQHAGAEASVRETPRRRLNIELLVIDLETCARCVPTGERLRAAIRLLAPAAEALGIGLTYRETVVQTAEEAKARALLSSPTIRINGRDIAQDIRESECESCGDLTDNGVGVDCREWHYRGQVYSAAPLPFLVETLMDAMLGLDDAPLVATVPLNELPENLQRFFDNKRPGAASGCCC